MRTVSSWRQDGTWRLLAGYRESRSRVPSLKILTILFRANISKAETGMDVTRRYLDSNRKT
jgi:hypothetical protein